MTGGTSTLGLRADSELPSKAYGGDVTDNNGLAAQLGSHLDPGAGGTAASRTIRRWRHGGSAYRWPVQALQMSAPVHNPNPSRMPSKTGNRGRRGSAHEKRPIENRALGRLAGLAVRLDRLQR